MTEPSASELDAAVEHFSKMTDEELAAWTEEQEHAARKRGAKPERLGDSALSEEGRTVPVGVRMPVVLQNAIKEIAGARGVKYQTLIMRWLEEKVAEERSEADTVLIRITTDALRRALETGQLALDVPRKAS